MQPTDDAGAVRDQVVMPVGEEAQHGVVIDGGDGPQAVMA